MTFRPLLGAGITLVEDNAVDSKTLKPVKLIFPKLASPKLDGIRCLIIGGVAHTRSLKPVRNSNVRFWLDCMDYNGLDGEIIAGDPTDRMAFRKTTTAVMSEHAVVPFTYWIFDHTRFEERFADRFDKITKMYGDHIVTRPEHIRVVPHTVINSIEELITYEQKCIEEGYEGVILRDPNGKYKYGRSTINEGILLKIKRFDEVTNEAVIIGFEEYLQNNNPAYIDELGYQKRTAHKENKIPQNTLGKLIVQEGDKVFKIGSGFTMSERDDIWNNREKYLGQYAHYKYFNYGGYDNPRIPIYKGIRNKDDM